MAPRRSAGGLLVLVVAGLLLAAAIDTSPAAGAAGGGPQAQITAGPHVTFKRGARFQFTADEEGATFECSLNGHRYHRCESPRRYTGLKLGRHVFRVRALGADGSPGPSATEQSFLVVDTRIGGRPPAATFYRRQRFQLRLEGAANSLDPHFECALDGRAFEACRQLYGTGRLGFGSHHLRVRAEVSGAGRDPSPARHSFRIEPRLVKFGRSVKGRDLTAYRVGEADAERTALVVGSIHGDETEGHEITELLRSRYEDIRGVELWIVRTVNPDGVARHTRGNANGVDLNRNFGEAWSGAAPRSSEEYAGPHPFSEPESRAVRDLTKRIEPALTVWYHQPWGAVLVPCHGRAAIQHAYARLAGMHTSCRGAGLPGTARRWQNERVGGHAFVVELGGGELSDSGARRNAGAVAQLASPGQG